MASRVQRRLAAILCADVAGYSRLMGADEEGTLAALKGLRSELIDPAIAEHRGRIVKTTGDGVLCEFASVVDAVRCAVAIQGNLHGRATPIRLRIGIVLGDIIIDGDDIYGDGVNLAARLEQAAQAGGLLISEDAFRQVRDKLDLAFADRGARSFKNIARAIGVWAWHPDGAAALPAQHDDAGPARLSIVVLPFANLGDPSDDYFADGITEDLTTDLSRIPDSFVIARNTAFTYKAGAVDVKQVGRDLGVRYVLEGSVRRGGAVVRVNAQLIDAASGAHLWADRFDCDRGALMEMQDDVTSRIASALGVQLVDAESRRSLRDRPTDPDAVDCAMRGWACLHRPVTRDTLLEGRALFERALSIEAGAIDAMIGLAYSYVRGVNSVFTDPREGDLARADELITQALMVAPGRARAHWVHGLVLRTQLRLEEAVAAYETALGLDRNFAGAYGSLGDVMTFLGKPEETIPLNQRAIRLSPRDPELGNWQFDIAAALYLLGRDEEALAWALRARAGNPNLPGPAFGLAAIYAMLGRIDEARQALADMHRLAPHVTSIARYRAAVPMLDYPAVREMGRRIDEGLRRAGLPEE